MTTSAKISTYRKVARGQSRSKYASSPATTSDSRNRSSATMSTANRIIFALCLAVSAHAATVFRVDPVPVMTTTGNTPPGGYPTLFAVPGATISACTDAACSLPATTYTDSTGNTACPINAPVTLPGTAVCTSTAGPQGQFGFWVAPGTYFYRVIFPNGLQFGPFAFTSNTAGVTSITAGTGISINVGVGAVTITNTGALSFNTRAGAVVPTTGDYTYSQIGGATQGNTTKPHMAGTNSGVAGAGLCNDANGNTTTSGCTIVVSVTAGTGISIGGTSTAPSVTNTGQLTLTAGTGLSSTGGQNPTLTNTGLLTATAGTGIGVTAGQNPTISNTGTLTVTAGTGIGVTAGQNPVVSNTGVLTFNTRPGAVVPTTGDYSFSQISGTAQPSQGGTGQVTLLAALQSLLSGNTQGLNTQKVQMGTGSPTAGHVPAYAADGSIADSGFAPAVTPAGTAPFQIFKSGLGPSFTGAFQNPATLYTVDFNYTAITPSGSPSLTSGTTPTLTIAPCPLGVTLSGTYATPFYISGGTGTAESVLPTGGTCTSGAISGTIILATLAFSHSGAYTLTAGENAIQYTMDWSSQQGLTPRIMMPSGTLTQHSQVVYTTNSLTLEGQGMWVTILSRASDYANGDLLLLGQSTFQNTRNFGVLNGTGGGTAVGFHIYRASQQLLDNVGCQSGDICWKFEGSGTSWLTNFDYNPGTNSAATGVELDASNNLPCTDINVGPGIAFSPASGHAFVVRGADGYSVHDVQGGNGSPWAIVAPNAGGGNPFTTGNYVSNGLWSNNLVDVCTSGQFHMKWDTVGAGTVSGLNLIRNNTFTNGGATCTNQPYGIQITTEAGGGTISGISIVGNGISNYGGPAIAFSNTAIDQTTIASNDINCVPGANVGCISANGATNLHITGNHIVASTTGYAVQLQGATGATEIVANSLKGPSADPITLDTGFGTFPTSLVMGQNKGIDDVIGTVADAATITLPIYPVFTLTGTGTAVTTVNTGTCWSGRQFQMLATNASPPQFTAGTTIGNTLTPAQNVPVVGHCNGSKVFLK